MAHGVSVLKFASRLSAALAGAAFLLPADCAAQGRAQRGRLPRIGAIKGYPEKTGLAAGCGNYYFHPIPYRPEALDHPLLFIANSDGTYAWMNLGGRDVRLTPLRLSRRDPRRARGFYYRHGALRVSVIFERFASGEMHDEDFRLKIRIVLRRGRAVRIARGIGYADC